MSIYSKNYIYIIIIYFYEQMSCDKIINNEKFYKIFNNNFF